jgi:hypothetical protein
LIAESFDHFLFFNGSYSNTVNSITQFPHPILMLETAPESAWPPRSDAAISNWISFFF